MPRHQSLTYTLILLCLLGTALAVSAGNGSQTLASLNCPKRMIILNSYNESSPWSQKMITPILAEASMQKDLACAVQHVNTMFLRSDSVADIVDSAIFRRFDRWKPNMVVCVGNQAFTLRDQIRNHWGDVPIVLISELDSISLDRSYYYAGQPDEIYDQPLTPLSSLRADYNFTYVGMPCYPKETVDMMVRMTPNMKYFVFTGNDIYNNKRYHRIISRYLKERYPNITYKRVMASEEGEEEMKAYMLSDEGKDAAVLFGTWFYQQKSLYGYETLISGDYRVLTYSRRPVFAMRDSYFNEKGFLGGYFYDIDEVQDRILQAVRAMVSGKDLREHPFSYPTSSHPYIDYRQLLLDDVDASDCPEDAIFINRPPTFWEQYSWYAILVAFIIVLITVIFFVTFKVMRKRQNILASHAKMLHNMPIFYAKAKVTMGSENRAQSIEYLEKNYMSQQTFADNTIDKDKNSLFEVSDILQAAEKVIKEYRILSFTHFFKTTGTHYEFILCPSHEKGIIDIFGIDSTARIHAEETLIDINKKLELTLSAAHVRPWTWDLKTDVITSELRTVNATNAGELPETDVTYKEQDAKDYFKSIHPDDLERVNAMYRAVLCNELTHARAEYRIIVREDGADQVRWVEVNAIAEHGENDIRPVRITGSVMDITGRKQQEQNLIEARNKAAESDKLKSAFLANVSHEIRTPLNAIIGFANLLVTAESDEERQEYFGIMESNNALLLKLINDILDLSQADSNTLNITQGPVNLEELMDGLLSTLSDKVKPTVKLEYTPNQSLSHTIVADESRVRQILINFINNSIKFTSVGSIVFGYEIRENYPHASLQQKNASAPQGEIYFFVRDTGEGLSEEDRKRVFERFFKVNYFIQGNGLGLSICESLVKQMGGRIGVHSEGKGMGCLFWFTLPLVYGKPIARDMRRAFKEKVAAAQSAATQPEEGGKPTILVAEDNKDNFLLIESLLHNRYNLLHAENGQECVQMYADARPHLILMDINMPIINGYEATEIIREHDKDIPIIAITAYAYASDKERILRSGFNDYVSKPVNHKALEEALRKFNVES